jgi:tetratricopeptide (TPR) repeat protein
MHRGSILLPIPCDLKQLPIGAIEAFVLSQIDGRSTAEDLAEVTGLELKELLRVARHLIDLGAVSVEGELAKTRRPPPHRRTEHPPPHPVAARPATLVPPAIVPKSRARDDLRSLGISPREGFVLSQIDGATSTEDLVEITHLSHRDLSDALHALEEVGAIELPHKKRRPTKVPAARQTKAPPPRATKAPPGRATKAPAPRATKAPPARATKAPPAPATQAPAARTTRAPRAHVMKEKRLSELPEADRLRITEAIARVEPLDHYAALGVERDADAKTIRRAYHSLAAQFHPDRFFRKDLGATRQPLERLFGRLTLAYDTLARAGTREAYDQTLPPPPRRPTERPPKTPTRKSIPAVRPVTQPPPAPKVEAIAPPPPPERAPPPVSVPTPVSARAAVPLPAEALRRMFAGKKRSEVHEHVEVFVRAAREALERDDVVAAANNYRLAVQVSDDPALRVALEEIDVKARARVRDVSVAGARAAEAGGRWADAAAKYVKAHGAHPEAWIAERAANAIRHEGGDLRRAAQLAEQAVLAEPSNAGYRVTLGEIYLDAGLMARAKGESGRAIALAPADPRALSLAKAVARVKAK